jgi:O-antigen ligase
MSSSVATIAYSFLILVLFVLDRDRKSHVSSALWIPMAWLCISASRTVAQWLAVGPEESLDQVSEGSPLDSVIFAGLIAAGLMVLFARGRLARTFLRENWPLLVLFSYCGVSILWSDFPLVSFKRWIKASGNLVVILVVLTDPDPAAAVKRLLARSGFLLIPLSMLLIKYYPSLGRSYSPWSGMAYYNGVSTGKNGLGFVCLIFGLGSVWRVLAVFRGAESSRKAGPLIAHGAVLLLTLWLFRMANSATSMACFLAGAVLIAVTSLPGLVRKQTGVHFLVGAILIGAFYGLILSPGSGAVEQLGRDSTLTGRTELWAQLISWPGDRIFGCGFSSFWLGERLKFFWETNWWHPKQSHNGYIEVLLNLGWTGVTMLTFVMAWGYQNVLGWFRRDEQAGGLRLAYFVVAILYNLTEATFFEIHPVWLAFLLAVTVVPDSLRSEGRR